MIARYNFGGYKRLAGIESPSSQSSATLSKLPVCGASRLILRSRPFWVAYSSTCSPTSGKASSNSPIALSIAARFGETPECACPEFVRGRDQKGPSKSSTSQLGSGITFPCGTWFDSLAAIARAR